MIDIINISKNVLIFSSLDRITSETIPHLYDVFINSGAKNINIIPSIGKKGRPNYLIFIDFPNERYHAIIEVLVKHAKSTGWYVLSKEHQHVKINEGEFEGSFQIDGQEKKYSVKYKLINSHEFIDVFLEYEDCHSLFMKYPLHFKTLDNLQNQITNLIKSKL